MKQPVSFNT
jgi:hypothetical protein